MARVLVVTLAAAGLLVAGAAQAQAQTAVDKGMKVYADQKCNLCHAIAGKGNAKGPLDEVGGKLTADQIRAWIVTPKDMSVKMKATRTPAMKAYPTLAKDDLDALVAYMLSLKKK